MDFRLSSILLGFLISVKLKTDATKLENDLDEHAVFRSRQRYFKLYPLQIKQYYKFFNRPFYNRHFFHSIKDKKNHADDKSFVDLTRDEDFIEPPHFRDKSKFSEDYIDISELARYGEPPAQKKVARNQNRNQKILIDVHGNTHQVLEILNKIARRYQPFQQRSNLDSETSSSSDSKESKESKNVPKNKEHLRYVPKRFQVINNNDEMVYDDDRNYVTIDTSSDFDDDGRSKASTASSSDESNTDGIIDELLYVQSPTRHLKTSEVDWRKRLPHFLPKRMHWSEIDHQDLSNYWINGPRGKFPALYKTPY